MSHIVTDNSFHNSSQLRITGYIFIHSAVSIFTVANVFMINSCGLNIKECQTVQLIIQLMIQLMISTSEAFTHRWYSISV